MSEESQLPADNFRWPIERRRQLQKLDFLLAELQSLNHGSAFLQHVQHAIETADELRRLNLEGPESFLRFLQREQFTEPESLLRRLAEANRHAVELLEYYIGNPSGWEHYDEAMS